MAFTPKQIIGAAVDLGRGAVNLVRRSPATHSTTSGAPSAVGAPKPGEPGGHKSSTAKKATKPPAGETKAPAAKPSRTKKTASK